jgi:hypothetical protein
MSLTEMALLSAYVNPCWISPFIIISHVGTSYTGPCFNATSVASPYVDSPEVRRGGGTRHVADR